MRAKDNPAIPGIGSGPFGAEPGFTSEDCAPECGPGKKGPDNDIPSRLGRMLYEDPAAMRRFSAMTKEEQSRIIKCAENGMDCKKLHDVLYRKENF